MSLEQTIDNLQIRNANMVTFVGTSNTMVDTTTGRIQTKGIQHNSNVITDVSGPHGRGVATLKKYPDIIFEKEKFEYNNSSNTYSQAGYTVSVSSQDANLTNDERGIVYYMFDGAGAGSSDNQWTSASASNYGAGTFNNTNAHYQIAATDVDGATIPHGEWIKLKMPKKIRLERVFLQPNLSNMNETPEDFKIYGSNDGTTWKLLITQTGMVPRDAGNDIVPATTISGYYDEYAIVITKIYNNAQPDTSIEELEFYGYEEDPPAGDHSVDTTFKSRFNNPQTTGVQVLVDGATGVGTNQISGGPDPSGNQSTYVTDGKYWTLNGTLTSNLAVEANTFLEGDQPHAVSVWFNSSNLEANVSNTCVFSIASEEKLDSVNLDLQSNTWHNLTYAYQGEGGSRVTYLDGRKVAEDQAEDTFGDYPPFAMTGYSQGGYVASASNEENTDRTAYTLFNDVESEGNGWRDTGGSFQAGTGGHYRSDGTYDPATGIPRANLGSDSGGIAFATADEGEWVKIELPYKIKLNYFTLQPRNSTGIANGSNPSLSWGRSEFIKNGKIWGSNDGINWSVVHTISGTSASSDTVINSYTVGSSVAYKYFAIVITATNTSTSYASSTSLSEWKLYGHRENDLVRLPDPTNVLKYPHITMTGYGQRGYKVTPSVAVNGATTGDNIGQNRRAWMAFNGITDGSANSFWQMGDNSHYNSSGDAVASHAPIVPGHTTRGGWLKLELPHKLLLNKVIVHSQNAKTLATGSEGVNSAKIYGSNNDTSWDVIKDTYTLSYANTSVTVAEDTISTSTAYKYIIFQITKTGGGPGATVRELEFYGTGVDSIPIQIGGGNIDKVANFRVYDRFIEEDQVNEIWNAQKEEFGRAKPQMVLQQGKLGIGTDAPQGSLSVADEPHNVEEFPPTALTGYKTYIEGHGDFCTSESNVYTSGYESYKAFNKNSTGTSGNWWTQSDAGIVPSYNTSSGDFSYFSYNSQYSTNVEGATKMGHWLQIEFPYKINYRYSDIQAPHHSIGRQPRAGYILGSNDLTGVWTSLHNFTNVTRTHAYESVRYTPPTVSTQTFKYFRLVIEELNGDQYAGIARWDIFGTREQGQSVIHDGQLTLTKSLNVPRIGPPLDADDTPRRDRLVVEYNTSTNPTFEGAVRDTSGRGNDGVMGSGVFYDANEKSLVLDNSTGGFIHRDFGPQISGNFIHSISMWVKGDTFATGYIDVILWIGDNVNNKRIEIYASTTSISYNFKNNQYDSSGSVGLADGVWNHIAFTYNGQTGSAGREIYVNGKVIAASHSGNAEALNITNPNLYIGSGPTSGNGYELDGSISNFKLYDCALTAAEVKTLYDMGRMGGEANPQRLHIAAPLDVRGDIHGGCPVYFQALYNANLQAARYDVAPYGTLIPFNKVFEHKGDCFDTSTGLFTAPIDGLYSFGYSVRKRGGSYDDFWTYIQKNGSPLNGTNNSPGRVYVASSTSGPESVFASQRFILDLSAGDTVGVIIATVNGLNAQISNGYNSFHGYYVGRGNGSFGSYSY